MFMRQGCQQIVPGGFETEDIGQVPEGRIVRVRDLGRVIDGFEDSDVKGRFNGKPAAGVTVFKTGDQDAIEIASRVKAYVAGKRGDPLERDRIGRIKHALGFKDDLDRIWQQARNDPFPATISIEVHSNLARFIEGRLDLLRRNGM